MKILKRNGQRVRFDKQKIVNAITKASNEQSEDSRLLDSQIYAIADVIEHRLMKLNQEVTVEAIQEMVIDELIALGKPYTELTKAYTIYRYNHELRRKANSTDEAILGLIHCTNKEAMDENSNKNALIAATQRDLIAGEVSRDLTSRMLLPEKISQAHKDGILHFHDADYFIQPIFNCFSSKTQFVTGDGVVAFNQCVDGQIVEVLDKDGNWRTATVKKYGKQKMQIVTLKMGRTIKQIKCTANHRWILKNGDVTTNLKVGDKLALLEPTNNTDEINSKMFTLGFILGDGNDYHGKNSEGVTVRLCQNKIQYLEHFIKAGYSVSSYQYDNGDIKLAKAGHAFKQSFLNSKAWKLLSKNDVISLFKGYYAADGFKDRHGIATSDARLAEMIRDISAVAGYFICSENKEVRNTNFKTNAILYVFRFMKYQTTNKNWRVVSIHKTSDAKHDAWCVEEPITHSFTLANGIVTGNCCLINISDMLDNGTCINGKMIESPKSFQVACTVMTQIIAAVASSQYGGQSVDIRHLAKYIRKAKEKIEKQIRETAPDLDETTFNALVQMRLKDEIKAGVQTIQYQINTLMTTNGQSPFVTLFMWLKEDEYIEETAMLIEEILKQRIQGIKNQHGVYVTPSFPHRGLLYKYFLYK